jgi:hypothetical protein
MLNRATGAYSPSPGWKFSGPTSFTRDQAIAFGIFGLVVGDAEASSLLVDPETAKRVIKFTLSKMALETNYRLDARGPGAIMHEYRSAFWPNGDLVADRQLDLIQQLAKQGWDTRWSEVEYQGRQQTICTEVLYYGADDVEARMVRWIVEFSLTYGWDWLYDEVNHMSGQRFRVVDCLRMMTSYLMLETEHWHLMVSTRTAEIGHDNKCLRDGTAAMTDASGRRPAAGTPMVFPDNQAIVSRALWLMARYLPDKFFDWGEKSRRRREWLDRSWQIQAETARRFAGEDGTFSMCLIWDLELKDWKPNGRFGSAVCDMVESGYFVVDPDNPFIQAAELERLLYQNLKRLFGPDMMTRVGPRMRELVPGTDYPLVDYQGMRSSWLVITALLARGLLEHHQGAVPAIALSRTLIKLCEQVGYQEYLVVDREGEVFQFLYLDPSRNGLADISDDLLAIEGQWRDGMHAYQVDASLDCMLWTAMACRRARYDVATTHVNGHGAAWIRNLPAPQAEELPDYIPTVWIVPVAILEDKAGVVTLV